MIGILTGTDYNPGIAGVGAKTALKLVKENQTLDRLLKKIDWNLDVSAQEIYEFFLHPPVTDEYKLEWKEPSVDKIIKFMVEEHDFSRERVAKVVEKLQESFTKSKQSTLKGWLGK